MLMVHGCAGVEGGGEGVGGEGEGVDRVFEGVIGRCQVYIYLMNVCAVYNTILKEALRCVCMCLWTPFLHRTRS